MSLRRANGSPIATTTVGSTDSASVVIAETLAEVADRDVDDLPRLSQSVDPDALDAVFAADGADGRLAFAYAGYDVVLDASGSVEVHSEATITS